MKIGLLLNNLFIQSVHYPSYRSSSPCSCPSPSSSSPCLGIAIVVHPLPVGRIPGPYPGPTPARRGLALCAASPSRAPPTGPALRPRLGPFPRRAPCPCLCRGPFPCPGLARASEGAAGSEERLAGRHGPSRFLASGRLCGSRAGGNRKQSK